jgi:hypothetical protein
MVDQATAETICNREGAHLASYTSLAEQVGMQRLACLALVLLHATPAPPASRWRAPTLLPPCAQAEVEQFYIKRAELVGSFHEGYWLGLQYNNESGAWYWNDFSQFDMEAGYSHWGVTVPDYVPEPSKNASCSVANASEAFDRPLAWGWSDATCTDLFPFVCRKAAGDAFVYVSNTTSATYILNTTELAFDAASQTCNDNGGNLVYYSSAEEQYEVEQHFIKKRELMPEYKHGFYWIGYKAAGNPAFDWVDPQARGIAYTHWGTYLRRLLRLSRLNRSSVAATANAQTAHKATHAMPLNAHCLLGPPLCSFRPA